MTSSHNQGKSGKNQQGGLVKLPTVLPDTKLVTGETRTVALWRSMRQITPARDLSHNLLFTGPRGSDQAAAVANQFDLLRTLLTEAMSRHGLRRVAISAPRSGCGTSFVAANLALSMARRRSLRVLLSDLNLRHPALANSFAVEDPGSLIAVLEGKRSVTKHLRRYSENLAMMLNGQRLEAGRVLLPEPETIAALDEISESLAPDIEIFDLPPLLESDDLLAFLPQVDGVILVVDGANSQAKDIRRAEALLQDRTRLIGVVMNRGETGPPEPTRLLRRLGRAVGIIKED